MGTIKIDTKNAKIPYANNELSKTNQVPKIIHEDIHHGALDLELIRDECLFEIFENTATTYPERPAVIFQNREYSYEEVNSYANRLAHYLREKGIQNGDKVGLILEKSAELYIAMLGIMKAGAAYVPIDSGYPKDRVEYIIENSGISLTVTSSAIAGFFGIYDNILLLDQERKLIENFSDKRLKRTETGATPDDLAYIIYTSGSTGRPKGVQIEHKSICNLVRASQKIYKIKPEDRVYQGFTVAFDASLEEIWMAFGHGAALVPQTPEMQKAGPNLGKMLNNTQITVLSCVPTLLSMMAEDIPSLRLIIFGGEACPQHLIEKWYRPARRLLNTYGPTEATVIATYSELEPGKKVTIGRPLPNYSVYIRHEDGSFAPQGDAGELLIGGIGLARGYIGREDLNNEKFIANSEVKDARAPKILYRTGDLARFNESGEIEFLGRIDSQVKIRGFRVELSEIESVINSANGVRTSVVSVNTTPAGIQKLAAYIVPERKKEAIDLAEVYNLLKDRLPSYMVPQYLDFIEEIPMLPSGKADRKSLPMPKNNIRSIKSGTEVKPRNETETKIAEAWKSVFKLESISVKDHFFNDLGGHSLFAAQTVSALRKDPKMAFLNFSDIYENPTIEQLAEKVASHKAARSNSKGIRDRKKNFLPSSPIKYALCGIGQAASIYLFGILASVVFLGIVYYLYNMYLSGTQTIETLVYTIVLILIGLSLIGLVTLPLAFFLPVVLKWVVIGRYKPGRYPLWGSYYFRWWLARQLHGISSVFVGTPLMPIYLRLMGAKVGKDCYIGTNNIQVFDLISIGDRTSIGQDTQLLGYTIEDGYLVLGNIDIGKECYVGTHSVLSPDSKMEDGSILLEQSMISEGVTIPSGETWSGASASITEPDNDVLAMKKSSFKETSLKKRLTFSLAHLVAMDFLGIVFGLIGLSTFVPVIAGLYLVYISYGLWGLALFLPLSVPLSIFVAGIEIAVVKKLALGKIKPGVYGIYTGFYIRKWLVDSLMHSTLTVFHTLYATLYVVPFLRALGVTIGKRAEISTVTHISPDLLYIGDESFFADASMAGTPKVFMNQFVLAESRIGKRTFIGNSALVPINTTIEDNCLIGVLSIPPKGKVTASGTSWLGTPAMYLHNRDINTDFSETQTYSPTRSLYAKRLLIEFFRVTLPAYNLLFFSILSLVSLYYMVTSIPFWGAVLLSPVVAFAFGIAAALIVALVKYALMGVYKPKARPLWSTFVWKTELVTGLYETMTAPLVSALRGTPFAAPILRLLGCKIGKRVFIDTTFISEFDLVKVEDEAAINFNSTMQTHLFEDRVMKMSHLVIGKRCTVGSGAVVLYDTVMEEGSKLGALSLLMKGETLPSWTSWEGNPARLNGEVTALYDVTTKEGSNTGTIEPLAKGKTLPSWTSLKRNWSKIRRALLVYDIILEEELINKKNRKK